MFPISGFLILPDSTVYTTVIPSNPCLYLLNKLKEKDEIVFPIELLDKSIDQGYVIVLTDKTDEDICNIYLDKKELLSSSNLDLLFASLKAVMSKYKLSRVYVTNAELSYLEVKTFSILKSWLLDEDPDITIMIGYSREEILNSLLSQTNLN